MKKPRVSTTDKPAGLWLRALWLDEAIRNQRDDGPSVTVKRIEEQFCVKYRTAIDTVAFLRDRLEAPIRYCKRRKGYVYTDNAFRMPSLIITQRQAEALLLLEQAATMLADPQRTEVIEMLHALARTMPPDVQVAASENMRRTHVATPPRGPDPSPRVMAAIEDGLYQNRLVDITYYTLRRAEETRRTIEPHFISMVDGDWHLVAFDHLSQSAHVFTLSRIRRAMALIETFSPRPELAPERYEQGRFRTDFGQAPFEVTLRVDEWQSRWLRERPVHATQQIEDLPDGGIVLRFTTSGKNDLIRWLLGHADHVEVVSPDWLRDEVMARIGRMAATYGLKP